MNDPVDSFGDDARRRPLAWPAHGGRTGAAAWRGRSMQRDARHALRSLAGITRNAAVSRWLVASWNDTATWWNPVAVIVLAWAVLVVPLIFFRGYNSDEGLAVTIARTAVETGQWLRPHLFNTPWLERPTLLSWIIAAISAPFGGVTQITARLPVALFLLLGCLLIYLLLRKVAASVPAALFGVALFMACPMVMRSYVMVTADLPLAVLLFLAFVLWWSGYAKGSLGMPRWVTIGVVLALAGLLKGPQPIAYFAFGIGLFVVGTRAWRQLPGLAVAGLICVAPLTAWYAAVYIPGVAGQWAAFMRIKGDSALPGPLPTALKFVAEALPALLMAAVFLIGQAFHGTAPQRRAFVAALSCYAFAASLVILFWPGGSTARYFYPMVLALGVFGGLGYDALSARRADIVAPFMLLTAGLLLYALGYAAASPWWPNLFRHSAVEASQMISLVHAAPAPIYTTTTTALNVLPYVPGQITNTTQSTLEAVTGPAWMVLPPDLAGYLLKLRHGALHVAMQNDAWMLLRLDP